MRYFLTIVLVYLLLPAEGQHYIRGRSYVLYQNVERYVISPKPAHSRYTWYYTNNTIEFLKPDNVDTMLFYTYPSSQSGSIICTLRDSTTLQVTDSLVFPLRISKTFVDANALAPLTGNCGLVFSDANLCQTNYIDYFELKNIQFSNNDCIFGGYQDLTASGYTTELDMGLNYTIKLKPKNTFLNVAGDTATLFYGVWLDYNNDGDFEDPGEFIKYGDSNRSSASLINIQILNNTSYAGPRRLRVSMRGTGGFNESDACSVVGASGETEDYLVTINPVGALYGPNLVSPNNDGINDFLILKGLDPDLSKERTLVIFDSYGRHVNTIENYNNDFNGKDNNGDLLPQGIYYYHFTNASRKLNNFFQLSY